MNDTNNYDGEGTQLQKLLDEVESGSEQAREQREDSGTRTDRTDRTEDGHDADILNLPPRKDVHGDRGRRTKLKISGASGRLLSVIVMLIVILGVSFYLWGDELMDAISRV